MLSLDWTMHNWRIKNGDQYYHATAATFAEFLATHCSAAADDGESCIGRLLDQVDQVDATYVVQNRRSPPVSNPFLEHLNTIAPVLPPRVRALVLSRLVNRAVYGPHGQALEDADFLSPYYYHRLEKFLKSPIIARDFIEMPICYKTRMHESLVFVKKFPQRAAELHAQGRFDPAKFARHVEMYALNIDCRMLRCFGRAPPHKHYKHYDYYEYDLARSVLPMMLEIAPLLYHGMQPGPKPRRFKAPRTDVHWTAVQLIFAYVMPVKPQGYYKFIALPPPVPSKKRRRGH
jgi:hypothetical protein